jgi:Transposase IS4
MAIPVGRPERHRTFPIRYDDEQAFEYYDAMETRELNRAIIRSIIPPDDSNDSDGEVMVEQDEIDEKEEVKKDVDMKDGWSDSAEPSDLHQFHQHNINRSQLNQCTTPLDFFSVFISDAVIRRITRETNRYARQRKENSNTEWQQCTDKEIRTFLAIVIYMGVVHLQNTHDYWNESLEISFANKHMFRDRFLDLLHHLHISNNNQRSAQTDRLHKIRYLLDHIIQSSQSNFAAGQNLCIDEAMVGFTGRSNMIQYVQGKAHPWGFKVFTLTDAATSYVLNMDIYTGAVAGTQREEGLAKRVVMQLLQNYHGHHHTLFIDNWYTNMPLVCELLSAGIYCTGTMRRDHTGIPIAFKGKKLGLQPHQWICKHKDKVLCVVWQDRSTVCLLSTVADGEKESKIKRRDADGEQKEVPCPAAIVSYQQHMRGVDVLSQIQQYYAIGRRVWKWWHTLMWWLIDMAIINAWILYNQKYVESPMSHKSFRLAIIDQLLRYGTEEDQKRPSHKRRTAPTAVHWPRKSNTEKECVECRTQSVRGRHGTRTRVVCAECGQHVCIVGTCWEKHISRYSSFS